MLLSLNLIQNHGILLKLTQQEVTYKLPSNHEETNMKDAPQKYNVYSKGCPARAFLDRMADHWSLLIIDLLQKESRRFNQLKRDIEGISQKVLSQKLKQLERDGLVSRTAFATVPVTVEYKLTDLGNSFAGTIEQVIKWAENNVHTLKDAHQQYDQTHATA